MGMTSSKTPRAHAPALKASLERYLKFGGLPAAVAEAADGEPEPTDKMLFRDGYTLVPAALLLWALG